MFRKTVVAEAADHRPNGSASHRPRTAARVLARGRATVEVNFLLN